MRRKGLIAIGLATAVLGGAGSASAFISANTIDEHATYTRDGTRVRVTGPIGCSPGERVSIRVTVTQAATGARARKATKGRCTGEIQHWGVRARTRQDASFEKGRGRVCAVGKTRDGAHVTDTRRWCERVDVSGGFR